jgi:membrane protein DedA with SNARE-associated domain
MDYFINLIYEYGLLAMFIIILIEYACFPISSEIVLPFSGAVASLQHVNYFLILILSVIAGLIGTSICYTLGRFGGGALIERIIHKFPKTEKGIRTSRDKFQHYGNAAVCFGRLIPLCRTYIAFIAGVARQNPITFLTYSCIGIFIWNAVLIGLGFFLRENWSKAAEYYTQYKDLMLPVIVLTGLAVYAKVRKRK